MESSRSGFTAFIVAILRILWMILRFMFRILFLCLLHHENRLGDRHRWSY